VSRKAFLLDGIIIDCKYLEIRLRDEFDAKTYGQLAKLLNRLEAEAKQLKKKLNEDEKT